MTRTSPRDRQRCPHRALCALDGEVLALRWCDIRDNTAFVDRSLCQTKDGLVFKSTKTEVPRKIALPPTMPEVMEAHRLRQDGFRGSMARITAWTSTWCSPTRMGRR